MALGFNSLGHNLGPLNISYLQLGGGMGRRRKVFGLKMQIPVPTGGCMYVPVALARAPHRKS